VGLRLGKIMQTLGGVMWGNYTGFECGYLGLRAIKLSCDGEEN
jgi:hypothetical protein